jgi:tRNA nucleotidyltransferase (CCA-adding enzyme)
MNITEALRRRDLTMNAMAIDLATGELIDPFHGQADMEQYILRSPDVSFFQDDPLRFYRVMQFIGRFEMYPDEALEAICKRMDISAVSTERIEDEFEKLLLKSKRPSRGIRWLSAIGRIHEILPELAHTQSVQQNPHWHPEGSVFEHLMQTVDAAARVHLPTSDENLILRYAALCHDLGKISTTILKDGVLKSPGHAEAGVPYTRALLKRITRKVKIIDTVALLVHHHMEPSQFVNLGAKLGAYRRLAIKLAKYTSLDMLAKLALCDRQGRNPESSVPLTVVPHFIELFLKKAHDAAVLHKPEPQALHGRDIEDLVPPGPLMGQLLHYAYELQLDEGITDKQVLRKKVIEKLTQESTKKPGN